MCSERGGRQIRAAHRIGAPVAEPHGGAHGDAEGAAREAEFGRIVEGARIAEEIGLECHVGHGLSFDTVAPVAAIANVAELNIGHFLVGEASFSGLASSIKRMGALVDGAGKVLGRGRNRREERGDPTAHAEVEALRDAAKQRGRWRLDETILYVTLEPCAMCAGALVNARVAQVVFGAWDKRAGAVESLFRICDDARLNHRLQVRGGVLEAPCRELLQEFFRAKRARKKGES